MPLRWGLLAAALVAAPAGARTLSVGPGQEYDRPSAAAAVAADGDTVLIEPGTYYDCAIWRASNLTIAGRAPGVVLTDVVCEGKALFVLRGDSIALRDLTLTRARVPDGNGAGVRLEAGAATFERLRFTNNQVGLLAGGGPGRTIVRDCVFEGGGMAGEQPTFALRVGPGTELSVTASTFSKTAGGQVRTDALRSELRGNRVVIDKPGLGIEASNDLLMEDNTLELTGEAGVAVRVLGGEAVLRRNRLINGTGRPVTLLLDWSQGSTVLDGNIVPPGDAEVASDGAWRHRAVSLLRDTKTGLRSVAGATKRTVLDLVR